MSPDPQRPDYDPQQPRYEDEPYGAAPYGAENDYPNAGHPGPDPYNDPYAAPYAPPQGAPADYLPEGYADEEEDEPERGRGCSWFLILGLALILCVGALVTWGVREITNRNLAAPLTQTFQDASLMPSARVAPALSDLQIQIYYIAGGRALAAEPRQIRKPASTLERLHMIRQELAKPPKSTLLESPLPKGTTIRALFMLDRVVVVDLSPEFLKVESPTPQRERLMVYALVNSFLLNKGEDQSPDQGPIAVRLMVNGYPIDTALGWLDLSKPLGPDLSLVK